MQRPREQAVDSEVFAHLADRGVELAKKLQHGGKVGGVCEPGLYRLLPSRLRQTSQPAAL